MMCGNGKTIFGYFLTIQTGQWFPTMLVKEDRLKQPTAVNKLLFNVVRSINTNDRRS